MDFSQPTINEFFQDRGILITGGLGFLGKVLVEKLMRSCPDIGPIYLLIRGKKGLNPQERLNKCLNLPVFDRIKRENPSALEKLVVIPGDVMSLGLGISQHHRSILEEKVSVIFHAAATVRFDDPLYSAVLLNLRGTREMLELATNMKNLKVAAHVSTTYCNTDMPDIGERVYPAKADWRKVIKMAETLETPTFNTLSLKLLGKMPNTYTYTKRLAEQMVAEYRERLPIIIFRPSIVLGTDTEPIPGWIDNFNGPCGLFAAGGKGVLRVAYCHPNVRCDYIPVDYTIKAMIIAVWVEGTSPKLSEEYIAALEEKKKEAPRGVSTACEIGDSPGQLRTYLSDQTSEKALSGSARRRSQLPVYNGSSGKIHKITMQRIVNMSSVLVQETPLPWMLWMPRWRLVDNFPEFYVCFLLTHLLPAVLVDTLARLAGYKPFLVRIQRHIYAANVALCYFTFSEWDFANDNFVALKEMTSPQDREEWDFPLEEVDLLGYMRRLFCGGRKYLLKEDESTIPQGKVHIYRMEWLDKIVWGLFYLFVIWYIYSRHLLSVGLSWIGDVVTGLLTLG